MIGIYKIISPSNKIYIGQSKHVEKRWLQYKNKNNSSSMGPKKYGVESHKFEIIKEYTKIKDVLKSLNSNRSQNLHSCLKGKYKTWMGYKWVGIL